jgi:hypothetical protein
MKLIITAALLLACSLAQAAALNVTIWNPYPGKDPLMFEQAMAAKAIQEKLGATVTIGFENTGRMHYAISGFENWQAYAAFTAKLQASEDWAAWQGEAGADPGSVQEENYLLNVLPGSNGGGGFYQVFIWDPRDLGIGALVEAGMEAKAIHEKSGVRVSINIDQMQRMHYVMNFDDMGHWAKVQDTPNPEFQQFMASQSADPRGDLVEVYTANRVP